MPQITIIGLGPGHPDLLTRRAWNALTSASTIYARTLRHPTFAGLPDTIPVVSFDSIYEQAEQFEDVYTGIAAEVIQLARQHDQIVYAVPGHPAVAETTVALIRQQAAAEGITVELIPGLSFIEPALEALQVDALPSLHLADAIELAQRHHPPFGPDTPALIAQLYSPDLASTVKLTLMNQYPDEHPVMLLHYLSTDRAEVEHCPLYAIDRSPHIAHLTALYVPPVELAAPASFESLQEIIAHLRAPDGCPWDRKQTRESLRTGLLEETYEALEAIDKGDVMAFCEELGDLLMHITMQTQIATEESEFHMADVLAAINHKMIRRHPHVFGDVQAGSAEEVLQNWEAIKAAERAEKGEQGGNSMLDSIPTVTPALTLAEAYQARVARVGFDWPTLDGIIAKVQEEIGEVQAAETDADRHDEIGDLLFVIANWARRLEIDPESALRQTCQRFARRFAHIEQTAASQGRQLAGMTLAELDALWDQAKLAVG